VEDAQKLQLSYAHANWEAWCKPTIAINTSHRPRGRYKYTSRVQGTHIKLFPLDFRGTYALPLG
jgi:hypothetical protein